MSYLLPSVATYDTAEPWMFAAFTSRFIVDLSIETLFLYKLVRHPLVRHQYFARLLAPFYFSDVLATFQCTLQCFYNLLCGRYALGDPGCLWQVLYISFSLAVNQASLCVAAYAAYRLLRYGDIFCMSRLYLLWFFCCIYGFITAFLSSVAPSRGVLRASGTYCLFSAHSIAGAFVTYGFMLGSPLVFQMVMFAKALHFRRGIARGRYRSRDGIVQHMYLSKIIAIFPVVYVCTLLLIVVSHVYEWAAGMRQAPATLDYLAVFNGHAGTTTAGFAMMYFNIPFRLAVLDTPGIRQVAACCFTLRARLHPCCGCCGCGGGCGGDCPAFLRRRRRRHSLLGALSLGGVAPGAAATAAAAVVPVDSIGGAAAAAASAGGGAGAGAAASSARRQQRGSRSRPRTTASRFPSLHRYSALGSLTTDGSPMDQLARLLSLPPFRAAFTQYLKRCFCLESLLFIDRVEELRALQRVADAVAAGGEDGVGGWCGGVDEDEEVKMAGVPLLSAPTLPAQHQVTAELLSPRPGTPRAGGDADTGAGAAAAAPLPPCAADVLAGCDALIATFVAEGSELQVNVSCATREAMMAAVAAPPFRECPDVAVFDEAHRVVSLLLRHDVLPRFYKSLLYKQLREGQRG